MPRSGATETNPAPPRSDTRALLASAAGPDAAVALITENPHPRLWRLLAEHALDSGDWGLAERGFVHCSDLSVGVCGRVLGSELLPADCGDFEGGADARHPLRSAASRARR